MQSKNAKIQQQAEQIEHYRNAFNDEARLCAKREQEIKRLTDELAFAVEHFDWNDTTDEEHRHISHLYETYKERT